jgi:hypothetical protein
MEQAIRYLHAAAGYPPEETWTNAINAGYYNTWPGLTATAVRCHFPELEETQKGHMKKQRQNVRLTKIKVENESTREKPLIIEKKMHDVYIKIHNVSNTMHSDQTGRFPGNIEQRQSIYNGVS